MSIEQVKVPAHHALRQAAVGLQSARRDLVVELPFKTTVKEALKVVNEAIEGADPTVLVFQPQRSGIGPKLRAAALPPAAFDPNSARKGQRILSTIDLGKDPVPRPRPSIFAALKENAKRIPPQDPYVLTIEPKLDEAKLALVSCKLTLFAIDGAKGDLEAQLHDQEALWDTGAHISVITEDLLSEDFQEYLKDPVHDPYRSLHGTQVTCTLRLGFSNEALQMDLIMLVAKCENIPNFRSGIILGQHTCFNRLSYTANPAAILNAKGEHIPDNIWGRIDVIDYLDLDGNIVKV